MAGRNNDWKERLGMVYSTNPDFTFETGSNDDNVELTPPSQQKLRVRIEKAGRGGKTASVISGFSGPGHELEALARSLKTYCGCGGSAKDGLIIIQGEMKDKLIARLKSLGYTQTK